MRARLGDGAVHQVDGAHQPVRDPSYRGCAQRPPDYRLLHRQPRQGRGGPGRAERQPDAGLAREDGPAFAGGLAMSVQLQPIDGGVTAPRGFVAGAMACGLKPSGRPDLALVASFTPAAVAGVFTTNRVKAAPVMLSQRRAAEGPARAVIVNT